jgi:hypothetical protein
LATNQTQPCNPTRERARSTEAPLREGELIGKDEHIWTRYGVASDAVFLIRPDGYIGFLGQQRTAPQVEQYLQTVAVKNNGLSAKPDVLAVSAAATMVIPAAAMVPLRSGAVFARPVMTGVAYMALPIPRLVCVEVVERLLAALRHRSGITVMRVVAIVYVAIEAAMTVKPRAGADEYPAAEPIGPVISVGGAVIRSVVEIAVRTSRLNTDVDTDLSICFESGCHQADASYH